MRIRSFLNGGLYRNTCQKLNLFVQNVKKNLKDGLVKIQDSVLINVDTKHIKNFLLGDGQNQQLLNVLFAKRNSESRITDLSLGEENIAQEDVMGKINQREWLGRRTLNILTEELRSILRHFIFQQSGEKYGKKSMREITGLARNVEKKVEDCVPIIKYQLENAKSPLINQTLLPFVIPVMKKRNLRGENGNF